MERYELEDSGELYDRKNDFLYPLLREQYNLKIFKTFEGSYIVAWKQPDGQWKFDDVNKTVEEWYATEIICGGLILETIPTKIINVLQYLKGKMPSDMIDEYFTVGAVTKYEKPNATWPTEYKWIAVYPVTGGSEGHYVHVDIINNDGGREMVFLAKTFQGMGHAQKIANTLQELLAA